ncbi:adhesin [Archangium violaceum]|uniref:adventurous gliding motility protein AgmC n=1 Tax=Archangium violaceum TaxID=83451 RepID=UPI002B311BEA|nr:adhesin [Archangium violaceum]
MKNGLFKKWLAAALCVLALGSTAALAEPDSFGLGTGRNGALSVTTAGTVINSYAQVTGPLAPGDITVPVGTCLGAPSCFAAGDLVMVLQTTGLVPVPPSGGTGAIDISNDPVGRWEFARLASVTGSTLTLTAPLIHSYAANVTQVIRVPEYTTVNLATTGRLIASPWNGSAGGIIAFLATGAVSNAGQINANSAGFRGGMYVDDDSGTTACSGLDEDAPKGAQKGEGIADVRYGPAHTGRGNVANGAGGGICYKSGGGGGGNYGAGGVGGRSEGSFDGARLVGGLGGTALVYSMLNHLTPGGGGGAGHGADGTGAPGGRGGGIIFIRANQLTGTGTIQASGGSGGSSAEDGGSGGGAGGSIYLRFAGTAACGSVSANGGVGGTVNTGRVGPGGGGGGGRVLFQAALGGTCNLILVGAAPGNQQDPTAPDGTTYGATVGANGNSVTLTGGFVVPSVPSVTTPADGLITSNRQPDIRGKAQPNTTVVIYIDGVEVGRTMSNASGDYIFGLPFALSEGNHTVQAATELNEVQSPRSAANTFTVDVTAPAAPVVSAPADGALLNTSKPAITGTAEPHSTVTVIIDGVAVGTVKADAAGNWSYTPTTALTEGPHTVKATAKDAAGNISPESAQNSFRVDTAAPAAPTVTTPSEGEYLKTPTPAITGKAEPDSTVTVIIDGVAVGTVKADAAGNWSYTPTTPLGEGPHTVKATAKDAAGNTSPESPVRNFFVDTVVPVAPVVVSPGSGSVVNDSTPTITGTAEANSTVTVIIDGVPVAVVPVDASGAWTYTPTTPLLDGSHEVKATATDAAGNTGPESAQNSFIVDTAVPAAPAVTAPSEGAHVKTPTPVITGTAEPHSTVTVIIDGVAVGTVTADAAGNWSYTPTTDLSEGPHTVKATAKDAAGNTSPESPVRNFTVDTVVPAVPVVTAPSEGAHVKTPTPVITGTAEPGSTITVIIDGVAAGTVTADAAGNWSYTPTTDLTEGPHTVTVTATDAAGNTSPESSVRNFTVDTAAPDTRIISGPPVLSNSKDATFAFEAVADSDVTYECKLSPATTFTPCTSPFDLTVPADGTYTFEVRAVDAAGNVDPTPASYTWTVDTAAPAAPVVTGPAGTVDTLTPVISGTAEPGSTVTVIIDGVEVGTAQTDASGNWSYTPATPLTEGPHTVTVRATDAAGNTSEGSAGHSFTIVQDTAAPDTTITSGPVGTTSENSATFTFDSNEPGVTYECSLDGADFAPCSSPVTFTGLSEGEHTVQVRARDAAGNVDATPATRTWTVSADSGNTGGDIAFLGDGVGCSATGGDASLVLVGLGMFLTLARRRRRQ